MASTSVILPTYNCGRFIAEAIESILGQTLPPDQIIIVDDGSTDNTEHVVRRFNDSRIEYIKQRNGGVSNARNTALSVARGEYIAFLDADDRWRPAYLERMHTLLASDPGAACAIANFVRFEHPSGRLLADQFTYYPELARPEPGSFVTIPKQKAFSVLVSCGEIPAFTPVMMFRRAMLDPIRFDTTLRLCEDTTFVLQVFMRGAVIYTDEVLADVRRHDSNCSRDVAEMSIHKLRALQALAPHVTGVHAAAFHDRLVKAYIDAALYRVRSGWQHYREGLRIPGSRRRKLKALVRMALSLV